MLEFLLHVMLVKLIVVSVAVVITALLTGLEVALVQARRAFIPESRSVSRGASLQDRPRYPVTEFVAASRLVIAMGLLASGVVLGDLRTMFLPAGGSAGVTSPAVYIALFLIVALLVAALFFALGYAIPTEVAKRFPDRTISMCAPIGRSVIKIMWPMLLVTRLVGRLTTSGSVPWYKVEEEALETDIRSLVEEGEKAGVIEEQEGEIISRVFKLGDKPVLSLMTPYRDVVFLRTSMTPDEAQRIVLKARFTWYPVLHGAENEVLGVVSAHDVFELYEKRGMSDSGLRDAVSTALDIPDSLTALELLERFREEGERFAIVRDEYGRIAGIATVDDVLKVIVGELGDGDGEERSVVRRDERSWLVDASSDVENLFEILGCAEQVSDEESPFHSVGGFVMTSLGRIPKEGESFVYSGYRFEVVDMDGKRIDKVLVERVGTKSAVGE